MDTTDLWTILALLFEDDYVLCSPEYIAQLCYDVGYTDIHYIKKVFFEEVFPVCYLPAILSTTDVSFDEKKVVMAVRRYKKSRLSQWIMPCLLGCVSKKYWNDIFADMERELEKLTKAHREE